jgi:hypothetical protein
MESSMTANRSSALAWWSAMTILLSAFLLFQVQPLISKKILPWFGGSPAVWTTCVLFFQVVLLGGYAYSHWLIRFVRPNLQGIVHLAILVIAVLTLPIIPSSWWKPADGNYPALRILALLTAEVGAPYFVLSTTGPLVQAWFAQLYPGRSPYRLYSLSNVGSLAALLTYPFLFEPNLPVDSQQTLWNQGALWSFAFIVFAVLIGVMALTMWRESKAAGAAKPAQPTVTAAEGLVAKEQGTKTAEAPIIDEPPSAFLRAGWLALAATASMSLLAITNHLCQDIAVVPFMWVIPLSLYLLSFIICFDNERWYIRKFWGAAAVLAILWLTAIRNYSAVDDWAVWTQKPITSARQKFADSRAKAEAAEKGTEPEVRKVQPIDFSDVTNKIFDGVDWTVKKIEKVLPAAIKPSFPFEFDVDTYDFHDHVFAVSAAFLIILFLICMVCHGELVKSKPQPQYLTSFFLYISAGGALGGLFVALICPVLFTTHFELPLSIICGFIAGCVALGNDGRNTWLKGRELVQWSAAFLLVGGLLLVAMGNRDDPGEDVIAIQRNFYGTVKVTKMGDEDSGTGGRGLYNGRIWHGFQYTDPARQLEPTTYYVPGTGAALSVMEHPRKDQGLRVAVIGLGTGSMAAHGREGDKYRFYDIDPKVVDVARKYFTYLDKSPAKPDVVLGDARISMERELADGGPQNYDVIVLDAFSGDAIPAHLLTDESFALYEKHLRKDESGRPEGIMAIHISNRYIELRPVVAALCRKYGYEAIDVNKEDEGGSMDTSSDWIVVTKNQEYLNRPAVKEAGQPLKADKELLWTDQFTALFPILK